MHINGEIDRTKPFISYIIALDHIPSSPRDLRELLFEGSWLENNEVSTIILAGSLSLDILEKKPLTLEEAKLIICESLLEKPPCFENSCQKNNCKVKVCECVKKFIDENKGKMLYEIHYEPEDDDYEQIKECWGIFSKIPHIFIAHF